MQDSVEDRDELAFVYDGVSLRAICFDMREVDWYRERAGMTVVLTPKGEELEDNSP